jgi:purine-cytosine permease-like protein
MLSNLSAFTKLHLVISLIGILSGLVVMFGLLVGQKLNRWTALFLISTVATSVTDSSFRSRELRLRSSLELSRWSCWRLRFSHAMRATLLDTGVGFMWCAP